MSAGRESSASDVPWVVVGCGYAGEHLVVRLASAGARVVVTTRERDHAAALARRPGVEARVLDPFEPGALDALDAGLPADAIWIHSVPPVRGRALLEPSLVVAAARARARRLVYLSATSVYPRGDGGWIDEDTPVAPDSPRGRLRLAAEDALFAAAAARGLEAVAVRIAAIYGPGRGVHARLLRGEHRVVGGGDNWFCRIHVEDLVSVLIAAATARPLARRVYLAADDEPATARAHSDGLAALLGVPPPPAAAAGAPGRDVADVHRGNRRVRNDRIKRELGVVLAYPTWREGVAACLRAPASCGERA